jgi:hypothetical protein
MAENINTKPVLVFDLDGTLAGRYVDFKEEDKTMADVQINPRLLNILRLADVARKEERIDAILLLTNNSDKFYIWVVQYIIGKLISGVSREEINGGNGRNIRNYPFFDDIMSRNDSRRPRRADGNPPKRLEDVQRMLEGIGSSTENLAGRIYFFDDIPDHDIRKHIVPAGGKYIHITPAYQPGMRDETDINEITSILTIRRENLPAGGGRKKRKTRIQRKSIPRTRKNLKSKHRK